MRQKTGERKKERERKGGDEIIKAFITYYHMKIVKQKKKERERERERKRERERERKTRLKE